MLGLGSADETYPCELIRSLDIATSCQEMHRRQQTERNYKREEDDDEDNIRPQGADEVDQAQDAHEDHEEAVAGIETGRVETARVVEPARGVEAGRVEGGHQHGAVAEPEAAEGTEDDEGEGIAEEELEDTGDEHEQAADEDVDSTMNEKEEWSAAASRSCQEDWKWQDLHRCGTIATCASPAHQVTSQRSKTQPITEQSPE